MLPALSLTLALGLGIAPGWVPAASASPGIPQGAAKQPRAQAPSATDAITVSVRGPHGNLLVFDPGTGAKPHAARFNQLVLPKPSDPQVPIDLVPDWLAVLATPNAESPGEIFSGPTWRPGPDLAHWVLDLPDRNDWVLSACGTNVGAATQIVRRDPGGASQEIVLELGPVKEPGLLHLVLQDPPGQTAGSAYAVYLRTPQGVQLSSPRRIWRWKRSPDSGFGQPMGPGEDCIVTLQVPAGPFLLEVAADQPFAHGCTSRERAVALPGPTRAAINLAPGGSSRLVLALPARVHISLPAGADKTIGATVSHLDGLPLERGLDSYGDLTWSGPPGPYQVTLIDAEGIERGATASTQPGDWLVADVHGNKLRLRSKDRVLEEEWQAMLAEFERLSRERGSASALPIDD